MPLGVMISVVSLAVVLPSSQEPSSTVAFGSWWMQSGSVQPPCSDAEIHRSSTHANRGMRGVVTDDGNVPDAATTLPLAVVSSISST